MVELPDKIPADEMDIRVSEWLLMGYEITRGLTGSKSCPFVCIDRGTGYYTQFYDLRGPHEQWIRDKAWDHSRRKHNR